MFWERSEVVEVYRVNIVKSALRTLRDNDRNW